MRHFSILGIAMMALLVQASSCKKKPKPPTDAAPAMVLEFKPLFDAQAMLLRTTEYTKTDGEVIKLLNWSMILSKVSLIKEDNSKVMLGDGYVMIDFNAQRTKTNFSNLPAGNYKGISFQFGLDSAVNHGDPDVWPDGHALSPLNGMHWGWAGGYIFQIMDGNYKPKDSTTFRTFSYHMVGDEFTHEFTFNMNFSLEKNSTKTATMEIDWNEFFKNPSAISIFGESNNHSGTTPEINWLKALQTNGYDAYKLVSVK